MKKLILSLLWLVSATAWAQDKEEPIVYYTDSDVADTKLSVQGYYAPSYATRRLALYDPVNDGSQLFALTSEKSGAVLGQRFGVIMYYELSDYFHFGVGFGQENSGFLTKGFAVFDQTAVTLDTLGVYTARTSFEALTVPLQLVFHTQMTDIWALQVVPSYDLLLHTSVERQWVDAPGHNTMSSQGVLGSMYRRGTDTTLASSFNSVIGFALGNEVNLTANLAFTLRAEFRLGLLPISQNDKGLREVPYSFGGAAGFRYYL